MGLLTPKNLSSWVANTRILSAQVVEEFTRVYGLLNGNLDDANISGLSQSKVAGLSAALATINSNIAALSGGSSVGLYSTITALTATSVAPASARTLGYTGINDGDGSDWQWVIGTRPPVVSKEIEYHNTDTTGYFRAVKVPRWKSSGAPTPIPPEPPRQYRGIQTIENRPDLGFPTSARQFYVPPSLLAISTGGTTPTVSSPYTMISVNTAAQLQAALNGTNVWIVVEDGVYDQRFTCTNQAHVIVARNVGKAHIRGAFEIGNNTAGALDGMVLVGFSFDTPTTANQSTNGAYIEMWGPNSRLRACKAMILDCTFDGLNGSGRPIVRHGIYCLDSKGKTIRRCTVKNMSYTGIRLNNNSGVYETSTGADISYISDCDISGIYGLNAQGVQGFGPGNSIDGQAVSYSGTGEAGLWIGCTAVVERVRTRNCGWMGLCTSNSALGGFFRDIDCRDSLYGVYVEHGSYDNEFENCVFHGSWIGGIIEWWYKNIGGNLDDGDFANYQGSKRTTFKYCEMVGGEWGFHSDQGNEGHVLLDCMIGTQNEGSHASFSPAAIRLVNNKNIVIARCDLSKRTGAATSILVVDHPNSGSPYPATGGHFPGNDNGSILTTNYTSYANKTS